METIYDGITEKDLREIRKVNRGKFSLMKIPSYDGWRLALINKQGYRLNVQKRAGQFDLTY